KYRRGQAPPEGSRMAKWKARYDRFDEVPRHWDVVEALVEVADAVERSPSQVALAWLLSKPEVSSVIIGARTTEQLDDNIGATGLTLNDAHLAKLDEASAIPMGYPYDFIANVDGRW
ncbi:MAG: aldo/keto reductase, partial [Myxococcota bacterium]